MTPDQQKTLHHTLIADCEARESQMTEWEQGFIDSIAKQIATRNLSDKQSDTLQRIWEKVTENG